MDQIGLGYHPDTRFADYISPDGTATYTAEEARQLDELTGQAFEFIDPYEIGMAEFERMIGTESAI